MKKISHYKNKQTKKGKENGNGQKMLWTRYLSLGKRGFKSDEKRDIAEFDLKGEGTVSLSELIILCRFPPDLNRYLLFRSTGLPGIRTEYFYFHSFTYEW